MRMVEQNAKKPDYKDQGLLLRVIGVLLIAVGIGLAFLAPLEMYCFYLFSAGGRFYYEGFGFGSFMFGNIASQIIGYYLIAVAMVTLGYGHLTRQRWIRKATIALLWTWLVIGIPMIGIVFFILAGTKQLSLAAALAALVFLGLSYLVFPALLIRYYQGSNVQLTLENTSPRSDWVEALPIPILVLSFLYLFFFIIFHILILFNGIFPLFGTFLFGFKGIIAIDVTGGLLVLLTWGTLHRHEWSWWGSVILFGMLSISTIMTFAMHSYIDILSVLAFPSTELQFLQGIPAQGYHLAILSGIPFILTGLIAVFSRRNFGVTINSADESKKAPV
jgi:hypothetical protein